MATYYWYVAANGNGSWTTAATNWYTGSGGTGSPASVAPGTADTVIFNAASGSGTCTVSNVSIGNIDATGFTGTITGSNTTISVYGSYVTLSETGIFAVNRNPVLQIMSGSTTTLTSRGQTVGDIIINNGSTLVLGDSLTVQNNVPITITAGTINANGKDIVAGSFIDNGSASTKSIIFGSGRWTFGAGGPPNNPAVTCALTGSNTTTNISGSQPIRLLRYQGISRLKTLGGIDSSTTSIQLYGALIQNSSTVTWGTTGTVLIDNEQITYTGLTVTSASNDVTLTGCTRGANETTATSHSQYAPVILIYPAPVTQLSSDLLSTESTTINAVNAGNIGGANGYLLIDSEAVGYASKTGTTFVTLTRGSSYGTTGTVTHLSGATIRSIESRTVNTGSLTMPQFECSTNGNYTFTDFSGNGANSAGGINNIIMTNTKMTNAGAQKITFTSGSDGTYYSNLYSIDEDFLAFFD